MAGPGPAGEEKTVRVFLGLGSNVGDRARHLAYGLRRLGERERVTGVSSVYETDPVGFREQGAFLNLVVRLDTARPARELLALCRVIEAAAGRERSFPNAPRTLDIDLLLYGEERFTDAELSVPHPRMAGRAFVLVPLLELEPDAREPGTGVPYADLLDPEPAGVRRLYPADRLTSPPA